MKENLFFLWVFPDMSVCDVDFRFMFYVTEMSKQRRLTMTEWRLQLRLTVVNGKAELLYHRQVPADSVQTVHTETCRTREHFFRFLYFILRNTGHIYELKKFKEGKKMGGKKSKEKTKHETFINPLLTEEEEGSRLIPVFSTCSMHILTKLGTVVFSRWHRLLRLQPNTWSVRRRRRRRTHWRSSLCSSSII